MALHLALALDWLLSCSCEKVSDKSNLKEGRVTRLTDSESLAGRMCLGKREWIVETNSPLRILGQGKEHRESSGQDALSRDLPL